MKNQSPMKSLPKALELSAERKSTGVIEGIFSELGRPCEFDVHIWPSISPSDAALRRGVAYARCSFYIDDKYLLTSTHPMALSQVVSLYDRMRAGIHSCLAEHNVTSHAGKELLNETAQTVLYLYGNGAYEDHDWISFARAFDARVRALGANSVLPVQMIPDCTDVSAQAANDSLFARFDAIGIGKLDARGTHLQIVKPAAGPA